MLRVLRRLFARFWRRIKRKLRDERRPAKTRLFLSYSRKDEIFTRRLAKALIERGYKPDFDQSARNPDSIDFGISPEDAWWPRLKEMIAAADVMVFIVSPDSAASEVCDKEIAYAQDLGKRIIPILRRRVDFGKLPPLLSGRHIGIDFTDDGDVAFARARNQLAVALNRDVAWHRESRRLVEMALRRETERRPEDLVMSPTDIKVTERLLDRRPKSADPPAQMLLDYLESSRRRQLEEKQKLDAFKRGEIQKRDANMRVQRNKILTRQQRNGGILTRGEASILKAQLEAYRGTHSDQDPFLVIKAAFRWHNRARGRKRKAQKNSAEVARTV